MSLYGALFAGVSALNAQSQSMGMISDNIANVNTVGYKRSEAAFSSLVTTSAGRSSAYAPGAVQASTQQRIDQQGILQQSKSSTDIAISGSGFFVVQKSIADGLQEPVFTRAGAFVENSQGYLVNTSGNYLMGWPLDANSTLPAGSADIGSLEPVTVSFLGGVTRPTTNAEIAINLKANETPYVYPVSSAAQANYSRSIKVFDSVGASHSVNMKFFKHTSPTAAMNGTVNIKSVTNLMDNINSLSSTATYTSSTAITGTLGATSSGLSTGDTMVINLNNESAVINFDSTWTIAQFAAAINAEFTGSPAAVSSNRLELTASTPIEIKAGGSQPASEATLNALGIVLATTLRDPLTFTVQVGSSAAQTVEIRDGDSAATLINRINSLDGVNAQFDTTGRVVIAADGFGENLVIGGVGGASPQVGATGFSQLGFAASTYSAPASPSLLGILGGPANPQKWWGVEFTDDNGIVVGEGSINFNGDGTINLASDPAIATLNGIDWGNGSNPQDIDIDIGNLTDLAGNYNVVYTSQNGAELGLRTGVSISKDGVVTARFSNGETTDIYKIPLATFANVNGLTAQNGNTYLQSTESGEYNLREAGTGSAGSIESSKVEASNVDLAEEFSKMIVTQRAYSAGTKVINTADQMLEELLRLR